MFLASVIGKRASNARKGSQMFFELISHRGSGIGNDGQPGATQRCQPSNLSI